MFLLELVFWLSLIFILYTYVGYPLFLLVADNFKSRKAFVNDGVIEEDVTFIVSALNEEKVIEERVRNVFSLNYDKSKINLIIVNDCSDDATLEVLQNTLDGEFSQYKEQVTIINNEQRRGKTGSLNIAVSQATTDLLFFTDANTHLAEDVLSLMVPYFVDNNVGAVRGQLILKDEDSSPELSKNEKSFWSIDTKMAIIESNLKSAVNLPGAIYMLRRELYKEIPLDYIIMDDFFQSIAVIEQEKRIVFEKKAIATEYVSKDQMGEFKRRVRIATANFNSFKFMNSSLSIKEMGMVSFFLWSHKIFRWFCFVPIILSILSIYLLSSVSVFFMLTFVAMMGTFFAAIIAHFNVKVSDGFDKVANGFYYFYVMNIALVLGFIKSFQESKPFWDRVEREDSES